MQRHRVDPAPLGVGGEQRHLTLGVERHDLAIVAAHDEALAVGGGRQNAAAHARRPCDLALGVDERDILLAADEGGAGAKEIHRGHAHPERNRLDAIGDGDDRGGIGGRRKTLSSRDDAALKTLANGLLRQFAADEDEAALALLAVLPFPLVVALQHHVDALEDVAVVIVVEGEDALGAQDLPALHLHQVLEPRHELLRIERLVGLQRQRLHVLVVIVLQAVAMIVVVMMVVAVMVIMVVVMIVGLQEIRLDVEDAVEVERAAVQHVRQGDRAALGAMQLGIGVDGADPGLDLGELRPWRRDRSC